MYCKWVYIYLFNNLCFIANSWCTYLATLSRFLVYPVFANIWHSVIMWFPVSICCLQSLLRDPYWYICYSISSLLFDLVWLLGILLLHWRYFLLLNKYWMLVYLRVFVFSNFSSMVIIFSCGLCVWFANFSAVRDVLKCIIALWMLLVSSLSIKYFLKLCIWL